MDSVESVRRDIASFVGDSGRCWSDPEVLDALNDARRLLYKLGNWKGTVDGLIIQPHQCVLTLPFEFDFITKAFICKRTMQIENQWFSPIIDGFETECGNRCEDNLINLGDKFASYRDYTVDRTFRLEVQAEGEDDKGVEIAFNATGEHGNRVLLTRVLKGPWEPVDANPITDDWILNFRSVVKPKTVGRVLVYIFDPNRDQRILCAIYEPDDINPFYRRYKLNGYNNSSRGIAVKAKRKYRKLLNDTDWVELSTEALIHACQALTSRSARNIPEFNANIGLATAYLNKELSSEDSIRNYPMKMSTRYRVDALGFEGDY